MPPLLLLPSGLPTSERPFTNQHRASLESSMICVTRIFERGAAQYASEQASAEEEMAFPPTPDEMMDWSKEIRIKEIGRRRVVAS